MRDESYLDEATRDALGDLRTRVKEQGITLAKSVREIERHKSKVEDLMGVLEEIAQGHDAKDMQQLALGALEEEATV